jgi:hypothetical protein
MFAYFDRFTIEMTKIQALDASHRGDCSDDVKLLRMRPKIKRQLAKITDDDLSAELKEYGAWDADELRDRENNELRILWIAAGNIRDDIDQRA